MADTVKVGPWGAQGGQPRDINPNSIPQRLKTMTISWASGNGRIIGFSFVYVDQSGQEIPAGPWGTIDPDHCEIISIQQDEQLDLISGTFDDSEGITSLKLTTNQLVHGPYGRTQGPAFSVPLQAGAGEVVAFFGQVRSVTAGNDTLNALGVYVLGKNGLPVMIGPWGGTSNKYINTPVQLQSVTVYSTQRINGFSFTYVDLNGNSIPVGPWGMATGQENTLPMSPGKGEYVNNITVSFDANGVTSLQFTTNKGLSRLYGRLSATIFSVPLPDKAVVGNRNGAVLGFFGRSGGDGLVALGVYVGVAPQPAQP